MKLCRTCGEEFSDKFVFCPVDAAPLVSASAPAPEPSAPATPAYVADERTTVVSAPAASVASIETPAADYVAASAPGNNGGNGNTPPESVPPTMTPRKGRSRCTPRAASTT